MVLPRVQRAGGPSEAHGRRRRMVIAASVIVLLSFVAIAWAVAEGTRRFLRWAWSSTPSTPPPAGETFEVPPFGSLPPLGPVGPLGALAPGADIDSAAMREHDLYGE